MHAALPLGEGVILDPFAGSGSTLAACESLEYRGVGIEIDKEYAELARRAIPALAALKVAEYQVFLVDLPDVGYVGSR
ncbi:MAG: hypothetical protein HYY02_05135 [Chloroflexi bacterium]|nr:hypothetical protein [Chloroflexota bacterium]